MYQNSFLLKTVWEKYYKFIVAGCVGIMIFSWPAYYVSDYFMFDDLFRIPVTPVRDVVSADPLDIVVHDNFQFAGNTDFKQIIIDKIDAAESEIIIAMYSFNIVEIKEALKEAARRGVKVKIAYEYANSLAFDAFIDDAKDLIEIKYIGVNKDEKNYHLHHKFAVFDKKELVAGSWNWSYMQQELDPNLLLEIGNAEIVDAYHTEFYRIWNGNYGRRKFFDWAYAPWIEKISYQDKSLVEVWFSPGRFKHSIQDRIIQVIRDADESIELAMTIMDSRNIAEELLQKAEAGVNVTMIVDRLTAEEVDSEYPYIKKMIEKRGLEDSFKLHLGGTEADPATGEYSIFHHHNMIVDDLVVVTGTANWTYGGFFLNDEDFLIITDQQIADGFTSIYQGYLDSIQ